MFRHILLSFVLAVTCIPLSSQPGQMRGRAAFDQVEAEKVAFFTRFIDLSTEEAKRFWPLYDEYQDRRNIIINERQSLRSVFLQEHPGLTERETEQMADKYIALQIREAELAREFHEKFKAVIPPVKVMRLYEAENMFRMQLLRRIRGGGQGRGAGPPR